MRIPHVVYVIGSLALVPISLLSQARALRTSVRTTDTAEGLLIALAGNWHFATYSVGQEKPVASGKRELRLLSDSTKLSWTEIFDGRADTGTGIIGHNAATGTYYVLGVYTNEPDPIVLTGQTDQSPHIIAFDPALPARQLARPGVFTASELRFIDANHFEWNASDGRWRTVFTRLGPS